MKKRNRIVLFLMGLALLSLLALAVIVAFIQWQSGLITEQAQRELQNIEADLDRLTRAMDEAADLAREEAHMADGDLRTEAIEIPDSSLPRQAEADEALSLTEAATEASMRPESESDPSGETASHRVIFVGDSRTVGMGHAEADRGDACVYIGESGEGYGWLVEYGIDLLDEAIRSCPSAPVVFNFGVNDCESIEAYIEVYHSIEAGYPDTDFYYMSVNPVTPESVNVPLTDVLAFNRKLKAAFPKRYIDTCSWMIRGGYEDVDGVHYSEDQYCKIHDFAVDAIREMNPAAFA